jgi:hypothetical protein
MNLLNERQKIIYRKNKKWMKSVYKMAPRIREEIF